jgi:hypothetical protein
MDDWRETVENGVHEFRRDFGGACSRSLKLSRAQACQLHRAALLAKAVPVLIYFKARD